MEDRNSNQDDQLRLSKNAFTKKDLIRLLRHIEETRWPGKEYSILDVFVYPLMATSIKFLLNSYSPLPKPEPELVNQLKNVINCKCSICKCGKGKGPKKSKLNRILKELGLSEEDEDEIDLITDDTKYKYVSEMRKGDKLKDTLTFLEWREMKRKQFGAKLNGDKAEDKTTEKAEDKTTEDKTTEKAEDKTTEAEEIICAPSHEEELDYLKFKSLPYIADADFDEINKTENMPLYIIGKPIQLGFTSGLVYEGYFEQMMMNGFGVLKYSNGNVFKGNLKHGVANGFGRIDRKDGSFYQGGIKQNVKHGYGMEITFLNTSKEKGIGNENENNDEKQTGLYFGHWKNGMKHDKGLNVFSLNNWYEGYWDEGKMHGFGVRVYPNGCCYIGSWKYGQRHGKGIMMWANNDIYNGDWKDGKMDGEGAYHWRVFQVTEWLMSPFQNCFVGKWKKGLRHGFGTLHCANGVILKAEWKCGIKEGCGELISGNGTIYQSDKFFTKDNITAGTERVATPDSEKEYKKSTIKQKNNVEPLEDSSKSSLDEKDKIESEEFRGYQPTMVPINAPIQTIDFTWHIYKLFVPENMAKILPPETNYLAWFPEGKVYYIFDNEAEWLERVILNRGPDLQYAYYQYASGSTKPGKLKFKPALLRICLWKMLRDCGLFLTNLSLPDLDKEVGLGTEPFEQVTVCEMINYLLILSWEIHVKQKIFNPNIPAIIASAFDSFIEETLLQAARLYVGNILLMFRYVPLNALYSLFKSLQQPLTVQSLVQIISPAHERFRDILPRPNKILRKLAKGLNIFQPDGFVEYIPFRDNYLDEAKKKKKYFLVEASDLSILGMLGLESVVHVIREVLPNVLIPEGVVKSNYEVTFLDFCDILSELVIMYLNVATGEIDPELEGIASEEEVEEEECEETFNSEEESEKDVECSDDESNEEDEEQDEKERDASGAETDSEESREPRCEEIATVKGDDYRYSSLEEYEEEVKSEDSDISCYCSSCIGSESVISPNNADSCVTLTDVENLPHIKDDPFASEDITSPDMSDDSLIIPNKNKNETNKENKPSIQGREAVSSSESTPSELAMCPVIIKPEEYSSPEEYYKKTSDSYSTLVLESIPGSDEPAVKRLDYASSEEETLSEEITDHLLKKEALANMTHTLSSSARMTSSGSSEISDDYRNYGGDESGVDADDERGAHKKGDSNDSDIDWMDTEIDSDASDMELLPDDIFKSMLAKFAAKTKNGPIPNDDSVYLSSNSGSSIYKTGEEDQLMKDLQFKDELLLTEEYEYTDDTETVSDSDYVSSSKGGSVEQGDEDDDINGCGVEEIPDYYEETDIETEKGTKDYEEYEQEDDDKTVDSIVLRERNYKNLLITLSCLMRSSKSILENDEKRGKKSDYQKFRQILDKLSNSNKKIEKINDDILVENIESLKNLPFTMLATKISKLYNILNTMMKKGVLIKGGKFKFIRDRLENAFLRQFITPTDDEEPKVRHDKIESGAETGASVASTESSIYSEREYYKYRLAVDYHDMIESDSSDEWYCRGCPVSSSEPSTEQSSERPRSPGISTLSSNSTFSYYQSNGEDGPGAELDTSCTDNDESIYDLNGKSTSTITISNTESSEEESSIEFTHININIKRGDEPLSNPELIYHCKDQEEKPDLSIMLRNALFGRRGGPERLQELLTHLGVPQMLEIHQRKPLNIDEQEEKIVVERPSIWESQENVRKFKSGEIEKLMADMVKGPDKNAQQKTTDDKTKPPQIKVTSKKSQSTAENTDKGKAEDEAEEKPQLNVKDYMSDESDNYDFDRFIHMFEPEHIKQIDYDYFFDLPPIENPLIRSYHTADEINNNDTHHSRVNKRGFYEF